MTTCATEDSQRRHRLKTCATAEDDEGRHRLKTCATEDGEGLPVPREPALAASAGRMPKRSRHRVSEAQEGAANVRRRGMGSPERARIE